MTLLEKLNKSNFVRVQFPVIEGRARFEVEKEQNEIDNLVETVGIVISTDNIECLYENVYKIYNCKFRRIENVSVIYLSEEIRQHISKILGLRGYVFYECNHGFLEILDIEPNCDEPIIL